MNMMIIMFLPKNIIETDQTPMCTIQFQTLLIFLDIGNFDDGCLLSCSAM
jgi:hypothetical protein